MMKRAVLIAGVLGLVMLAIGAALYAVNVAQQGLMRWVLIAGAVLVAAFALLNARNITAFFKTRSARHGANMVVMIVLFTSIIVIVQALSVRHRYRVDLTRNKRFSLAPQTINILRGLDDDLRLYGFFRPSADRERTKNLFEQFAHQSPHVRFEFIDPDRDPTRATDMGVAGYGTIVVGYGDKSEQMTTITEQALINSVLKLTREERKRVCFIIGHGEKDLAREEPSGYSILRETLENQNYDVSGLSLFDAPVVPDECALLVIAGPKSDYFDAEITKIRDYLSAGKNALFMIDARQTLPNLEALLARYRVILGEDVVIDPYSRIFGTEYTVPVVTQYVEHPITNAIDVATFYPMARSVRIATADIPGVRVQYLAQTGKSAWGETDLEGVKAGQAVRDETDLEGPVSIALIAAKKYRDGVGDAMGQDESEIVVFGDSDFADNSAFRQTGNGDLFLNVINYLAEEKDLIALRPKEGLGDQIFLTAAQGRLVFLISVVLLPLSVLGFGVSVFANRRKTG